MRFHKKRTQTHTLMGFTRSEILDAIRAHLDKTVPLDAELSIQVPGGGDWSGATLCLDDKDVSLDVRFSKVEVS